mmetsp:Transcript_37581/g.115820  ORF Transcript_37581/g.115820 Transcript_37581/m.115820 type:complete len:214 (+) Transcript_37581:131-772(+)
MPALHLGGQEERHRKALGSAIFRRQQGDKPGAPASVQEVVCPQVGHAIPRLRGSTFGKWRDTGAHLQALHGPASCTCYCRGGSGRASFCAPTSCQRCSSGAEVCGRTDSLGRWQQLGQHQLVHRLLEGRAHLVGEREFYVGFQWQLQRRRLGQFWLGRLEARRQVEMTSKFRLAAVVPGAASCAPGAALRREGLSSAWRGRRRCLVHWHKQGE